MADRERPIRLVPYSRAYLDLSWRWLRDAEIKALTMTPDFTREDQLAFFNSLEGRADYKIWGVEAADGSAIGAAGIKKIDGATGESWCYIGERDWWGRGIGAHILTLCEGKALDLGLETLTMIALATNQRSIRVYEKMGFARDGAGPVEGTVRMSKSLSQ